MVPRARLCKRLLDRSADGILKDDIVSAAFHDACGGYEGQLRVFLEVLDRQCAAVAHGGLDLEERLAHIIAKRAGIRNVGVDAFFELHAGVAAQIVALPVTGACRTFAPVFLVVITVDLDLVCRRFIEPGEVTAEHEEVRTHGQRQRHVIIMENAPEWSRLIEDCFAGKVDLIITQKISNVSREPGEVAFCSRMLAAQDPPVGIYFVSEDVFTLASYYLEDLLDPEFFPSDDWQLLPNPDTVQGDTSEE